MGLGFWDVEVNCMIGWLLNGQSSVVEEVGVKLVRAWDASHVYIESSFCLFCLFNLLFGC